LRAPGKSRGQRIAAPAISVRLIPQVTLEAQADGKVAAAIEGYGIGLGKFSADAITRAQALHTGLALASFASDGPTPDREIDLLVRRLAQRGLVEYRFGRAGEDKDQVVIEPQASGYWPRTPEIGDAETLALSRFAYLRRRGNAMVLESPRAGALFRIVDPDIAAAIATLSAPQQLKELRRQERFPGITLLALLVDCGMLFRTDAADGDNPRASEGDDNLVLWDFHDLLFHTHSTEGRQASPIGGLYPYADVMPPPPAVRPRWPGTMIDLGKFSTTALETPSPLAKLMQARRSTRDFDDRQPITLTELSCFLDSAARVRTKWTSTVDLGDGSGPDVEHTSRPYPSAGSAYELELYLAVANCDGLARGFYHYDADAHALAPIAARPQELDVLLASAEFAMDAPAVPQVLITIAARFNRISWKYSGIAYALILKDVGVLIQTLYLVATEMGLGGCAIGTNNIDLFAKMTGIEFHIEGPVGQFALGRGAAPGNSG
jgi:SagB-type dehydrogenase family enzyme